MALEPPPTQAITASGSHLVFSITATDLAGNTSAATTWTDDVAPNAPGMPALDAASDVLPGQYTLEVSTPGTSRPLTEPRHFKRARGRRVSLALRDGRTYEGRLTDVEGDELVLTEVPAGQPERVDRSDVARGSIEVELSRSAGTTDDEEA